MLNEHKIGLGYDIGCSFTTTLSKSSIALKVRSQDIHLVTPSFHGYAHNRLCQLTYHPLFIRGFGLEDFETTKRMFSSWNGLANVTRYATAYYRKQVIDLYVRQHDIDKYQELCARNFLSCSSYTNDSLIAKFILGNYCQVDNILRELPDAIKALQQNKSKEETVYHEHLEAERAFLLNKQHESVEDDVNCDYILLLLEYQKAV
jgi:hypothetical protein